MKKSVRKLRNRSLKKYRNLKRLRKKLKKKELRKKLKNMKII